jgi:hypothetical protein
MMLAQLESRMALFDKQFKHRDLGGLYCPRCAVAIRRATNEPGLFTRVEGDNPPQLGWTVFYAGDKGTVLRGVLAERRIGPLSGNPVYRVTDTHQEARDLDAGVWIGINDVIRFQE